MLLLIYYRPSLCCWLTEHHSLKLHPLPHLGTSLHSGYKLYGVDPDITYCVDVINSTSSVTVHLECDITMTEFSYPIPQDAVCHSYVLTITPVNVVGRGVSSSVSYIGTEAGTVSKC